LFFAGCIARLKNDYKLASFSLFVWLVAGADLFWEKSTPGGLLVAGLL
jgi:hypothetical protein